MDSYLVQAAQSWADYLAEPPSLPEGLFYLSNALSLLERPEGGGRRLETWQGYDYDFEFDSKLSDSLADSKFEASIYNLTDATIKTLQVGRYLAMHGGYGARESDQGMYGTGRISGVETKWSGPDKITTIYGSNSGESASRAVEKSFEAGATSGQILRWLCEELGAPIAAFVVQNDRVLAEAVTVEGDLGGKLDEYARMCGVWAYMVAGLLYVQDMKLDPQWNVYILNEFTGLLDAPAPFTEEIQDTRSEDAEQSGAVIVYEGYNLKCLLNHRLCPGAGVELTSAGRTGRYLVRSVKHSYTSAGGVTEAKVIGTVNGEYVAGVFAESRER